MFRRSSAGPVELSAFPPSRAPLDLPEAPGSQVISDAGLARWRLRESLRPIQPFARQRKCGRVAMGPVEIGPGWIIGLAQCGSVHACPVCSARLRAERATEIRALVATWKTAHPEGGAGLLTLTIRHAWGWDLGALRRALGAAWRRLWSGSGAAELRRPVAHLIRAIDSTHGEAGWHPHLHVLALYPHAAPGEDWRAEIARRWAWAVESELGPRARPREDDVGVRWDPIVRSDYLVKLGLEVAGNEKRTKLQGDERADPWSIARNAVAEYPAFRSGDTTTRWLFRWQDFARAMRGARALTWSHGTHRLASRAVEEPDRPEATAFPWAVIVTGEDWTRTMLHGASRYSLADLIEATMVGPDAALDLLEANGCSPRRMAATELVTLLETTGGVFDEPNVFAKRRFVDETSRRRELDRDLEDDRDCHAAPLPAGA